MHRTFWRVSRLAAIALSALAGPAPAMADEAKPPDLVVTRVNAPAQALVSEPLDVVVTVAERGGDTAAQANVVVTWGQPASLQLPVSVPAGGSVRLTFSGVAYGRPLVSRVTAQVRDVSPQESDATNNTAEDVVDVTQHELLRNDILVSELGGYGSQFNNHLYAPITPWPADTGYGDVEAKVKRLEPQLVRIFYNDNWDANANGQFPDWEANYASFVRSVGLAQEAGATVLVSYQNLGNARRAPVAAMAKFADVLEALVRERKYDNVRWAEVGNEPNDPRGAVTLDEYNALYRALDAQLASRGLRTHVRLMGGGLIESSGLRHHYAWLKWIAANMSDVLDAYSEHIYWWYDSPGRLEYRLRDVRHLVAQELPPEQRKPLYVMEFGVRGLDVCGTKPEFGNLYYADPAGTCPEIWRTNIAAFQQLWFNIASAQLGVFGTAKWDAMWGRYDRSSANNQLYWMIGPPNEGSPLTPTYHAMSLLFRTTEPGWQILRVAPWKPDDESIAVYGGIGGNASDDQAEMELVGYAGTRGQVTVVGLDTRGQMLNGVGSEEPAYSVGGLPRYTTMNLLVWNANGDGTLKVAEKLRTNRIGVARFHVPLHAAFSLTTVPVD